MDVALIAVMGTLLGVVATHWFQGRATERTAALARNEQLRQERIETYSAFAGAVVEYRHSQNDRWFRAAMKPGSKEAEESRHASYRQRTAARQALFRVQLVCDDPETRRLAEAAFVESHCMHDAVDEADRARRSEQAKESLATFIAAAAPGVR
ncbi:hypothetical protein [Streptomyces gardneri]|uniref:Uncharacterized protein n=1 Tax=Streptomyces gardneri TaxID=66892 RepID=A0A4Y3RNI9_9ACTN|nr:hypothetical protein [Streptomyces gardneri]ALO07602.1 hypothetical protein AQF52_2006 [Streptomyces venezuelae]QPK44913.1 hypothetical protein H4W23_09980 [Streptomyces gardneri]WRK36227.1 hypothetical protein U0M97_10025 [Streptomyces venezuelae]CUM42072.1 hypothetical protein BN2537_13109 [Streptomyces venezuelae]GEB59152.1 hypothetical protein SGA01_47570 [Streptomyces gardneri]